MRLPRGSIVILDLAPTVGHEQRGVWPGLVVSDEAVGASQRFPLIAIVPLTGTKGVGAMYPELRPGVSGLRRTSYAMIDHLRAVDKRRLREVLGSVTSEELAAIDLGLRLFLGLDQGPVEATQG